MDFLPVEGRLCLSVVSVAAGAGAGLHQIKILVHPAHVSPFSILLIRNGKGISITTFALIYLVNFTFFKNFRFLFAIC